MIVPLHHHVRPFDAGRFLTDQAAVRAFLRHHLQPEATRLACCYWWPTHELPDAQAEMRRALSRLLVQARVGRSMDDQTRAFADDVLAEAIEYIDGQHGEHWQQLCDLAQAKRQAGADRLAATTAIVAAARTMLPLPPPWLVRDAAAQGWPAVQVPRPRTAPRRPTQGYRRHG